MWAPKSAKQANIISCCPSKVSSDIFPPNAIIKDKVPNDPILESFIISKAFSRFMLPPRPSVKSASPSSWKAPVSIKPTNVDAKAATKGVAGRSGNLEAINQ